MSEFDERLVKEFLNINWLRPECVIWSAKAAQLLRGYFPRNPSLDIGCGNGLTMFLAAGGGLDIQYDWFINAATEGFLEGRDIYDSDAGVGISEYISRKPSHFMDCGVDHKKNLISQAGQLSGFYRKTLTADAQRDLRSLFRKGEFLDVYSNILYWLDNPEDVINDVFHLMRPGGRFIACAPRRVFFENRFSFKHREAGPLSGILKLLDRGRSDSYRTEATDEALAGYCEAAGFKLISRENYVSPTTLMVWDIGLRPLSPVLISMANSFSPEMRLSKKKEFMELLMVYLRELWKLEENAPREKMAFSQLVFQKP